MKKKLIISISILLLIVLIVVGAYLYLTQVEWYVSGGSEGHYSNDTYQPGGVSESEYKDSFKIRYFYTIKSGDIIIEVTDENGAVLVHKLIEESCEGELDVIIDHPQTCYITSYTETPDIDIIETTEIVEQRTKLDSILNDLDKMTGGRIYGDSDR